VPGPGGKLRTTDRIPTVAAELDGAVYAAAGRGVAQRELADDPEVSAALERIRAALVGEGWLLDEATRERVRRASLPVFGLAVVGWARLATGVGTGRPVGFLVVELLAVVFAQTLLLIVPRTSRAARDMLDNQRRDRAELTPAQAPSWAVYGASGAALGVALFGTEALWIADPTFADEAKVVRHTATSGGGGGDTGGGGGDSGGGGDGSSGCGGGCGG